MREKRREKKLGNSATEESERKTTKTKLTNQWILISESGKKLYLKSSQTWLLLGVEDTVDTKQWGTKERGKNNKNNKFVRRCSIYCDVSSVFYAKKEPQLEDYSLVCWWGAAKSRKYFTLIGARFSVKSIRSLFSQR